MNLYDCDDYKEYLQHALIERGSRTRLANALGCNTAYVSQVMSGITHLSLEQAERTAVSLGMNEKETLYFVLLVQFARSGTESLRKIFQNRLEELRNKRTQVQGRLENFTSLGASEQSIYYSAWYYLAIHVYTSLPHSHTVESIAKHFGLPTKTVTESLQFLTQTGLVHKKGRAYTVGKTSIHVGADSPFVGRHHSNWRLQAIQSLDNASEESLHYSSVVSMSRKDFAKAKKRFLDVISETRSLVRDSAEESVFCYNLDLFELT